MICLHTRSLNRQELGRCYSLLTLEVLGERKATRLEHNRSGRARHGRAVLRGEATFRGVNGWQSYGS